MNTPSIYAVGITCALTLSGAMAQEADDGRICGQPFGYDPATRVYQVIPVSCANIASILDLNPGYIPHPTQKNKKTGEQFNQIDDKNGNPLLFIYSPTRSTCSQR